MEKLLGTKVTFAILAVVLGFAPVVWLKLIDVLFKLSQAWDWEVAAAGIAATLAASFTVVSVVSIVAIIMFDSKSYN